MPTSRRHFLRNGSLALGGVLGSHHLNERALFAQPPEPILLPSYIADVNGDDSLSAADEKVVQSALFSSRGFDPKPRDNFDYRADVFARGVVDPDALESVSHTINLHKNPLINPLRRPITIAWHYGWYNLKKRQPGTQTVRYKGGDYVSRDPEVETEFNTLKNEFGITVDALSWIPVRSNKDLLDNYRRGFLAASNAKTRYVALLYESTIALPIINNRIDFVSQPPQLLLREDFRKMALFLAEARDDSPARIFTLGGRPVVFLFGSHIWGRFPVNFINFNAIEHALDEARQEFYDVYGEYPYLVGEEIALSTIGEFAADRRRRTTSFDAIYNYHHASNLKAGTETTLYMSSWYTQAHLSILWRTYVATGSLRNRYTGDQILVIPNLSPGFAKPGLPTLKVSREKYADFMKALASFHEKQYLQVYWRDREGTPELPAPIYITGSWNEEYEGHAVLPASFNLAFDQVLYQGFDFVMAIKELFGWNHYADRDIPASTSA